MNLFEKKFKQWKRNKAIKILTQSDPDDLIRYGEKQLFPAFQRAAGRVPAYGKLLKDRGVDWRSIRTVQDFQARVPVVTKQDIFADTPIDQLCVDGKIENMKLAMSSSGFSGVHSFGVNTPYNQKTISFSIDTALDYIFKTSQRKTFLVNCIPMGVKVPTDLQIAETSVRSDMALAVIKKFAGYFEQILIVSDPYFLKKLVEDGVEAGIDWKVMNVGLIFGEDWFSESFRLYLADLLGIDFTKPETGLIGATMGIAELDLNLFHETRQTIRLRQIAQENPALMARLFGEDLKACPTIFQYYPHRMFLETNDRNELIFSMLSPHFLIPLIRYNSMDKGYILPYNKLRDILVAEGLDECVPELKLPIVAVGGRNNSWLTIAGQRITPEEIKQGLYSDFEVASLTTGYFRMSEKDGVGQIEIQLKKQIVITPELRQKFRKALLRYSAADLEIVIYHYQDFPYAMELDYERKFKAI